MPTTATNSFSNTKLIPIMNPSQAREFDVSLAVSLTLAKGTVLGEVTATPGIYKAYASANVDGSQVPKAILSYAVTTDASGNITVANELGVTRISTPAYYSGTFNTADLTGLDANALTAGGMRLIEGSVTAGVVRLG